MIRVIRLVEGVEVCVFFEIRHYAMEGFSLWVGGDLIASGDVIYLVRNMMGGNRNVDSLPSQQRFDLGGGSGKSGKRRSLSDTSCLCNSAYLSDSTVRMILCFISGDSY